MTSDGDALFRAICEEPWEDTPRLAYADWLAEHGDPVRAAFIRHQMALARRDPDAVRDNARLTQTEFAGCGVRWHAELPTPSGVTWGGWERGFPVAAWFDGAKPFREHAAAVFAAAPVSFLGLRRVTARSIADVLRSPYLRRIDRFQPDARIGDDGVRQVAACPNLCNVASLNLSGVEMTDAGLEVLAKATVFDRLQVLQFGRNRVTDRGAFALLDSITLNELKEIGWHPNRLSAGAVGALRQRYHDRYTGTPAW